jgi:hypothetical protein
MAKYIRNIQTCRVELELVQLDPNAVKLDPSNPRVSFSMQQLEDQERSDAACTLILTSQEETENLKRSIIISGGVQEPIYVRADGTVAEGNRRVVALRAAQEEYPGDPRFAMLSAWRIPEGTSEKTIRDLLNEIHIGSVRGWAPYEKALQMKALVAGDLTESEVAERYRLTANDVRQQIAAVNMMDSIYFPITADPADPEHRSKFSYFLEFCKNTRLQNHCRSRPDLPERFARWVRDEKIDTGARVRRLPRVLDSEEATRLLDVVGFDAAEEYLRSKNPEEQELYALLAKARNRLHVLTVEELIELRDSEDRQEILTGLHAELAKVLEHVREGV